jgi:hypothetical protein
VRRLVIILGEGRGRRTVAAKPGRRGKSRS